MSDENKITEEMMDNIIQEVKEEQKSADDEKQKIVTDNDEIKEFNKTVLGRLDSPLIVHKKGDASYEESTAAFEMNETHTDEARPTLTRHRFKKEKKNHSGAYTVLIIVVLLAVAFAALYFTGNIKFEKNTTTVSEPETESTTETTTSLQEAYKGKIVVKDMYIFVDGEEVDGIAGLQDALAYETPNPTAYEIIDEHANADYLNFEILPIMEKMGFYDSATVITHIAKTGLIAYAETTTLPPETTTEPPTEKTEAQTEAEDTEE